MTALAFSYALVSYRGLFMPGLVHGARLADFVRGNRRLLLWAVIFGLALSGNGIACINASPGIRPRSLSF